jgi:hypothetical protein
MLFCAHTGRFCVGTDTAEFLARRHFALPVHAILTEFRSETLPDGVFAHGEHDGIIYRFKFGREGHE